jgi:DNA-binding transcriptional LysR family regulator
LLRALDRWLIDWDEALDALSLTALRYFIEVVDQRGFTAAAKTLHVAQPTLTRSMQNLEFKLDCKLLMREGSSFDLTPAGELLVRRGRMLLAEHRSMLSDLSVALGHRKEHVAVNGSLITSLHLLPQAVLRLANERPNLRVSLVGSNDANYTWKRSAILSGELDAALSIYDPSNAMEGLVQELLVEPVLRPMVRTGHPAIGKVEAFADLLKYPWIVLPGRAQTTFETEFRIRGLPSPRDTVAVSEWRMALDLLSATDHIAVVPYHSALLSDRMDRFATLPFTFQVRPLAISLLYRPLGAHREATRSFVETVKLIIAEAVQRDGAVRAVSHPSEPLGR